jgi:sucrose-6-phosphate hydrolase SacC (GH32 family)
MTRWANSESDRRRAEASVRAAASRIDEAGRPAIHFHPPAGWMNDPNGPLFTEGRYHAFYQHNPYADSWGHIHWGHACSDDLLSWRHLPIALAPNKNAGLEHCFSGTCVRRADGGYLIAFTAISEDHGRGVRRGAEQWGAVAGKGLTNWTPADAPVVTDRVHGQPVYEWRDPYCFRHNGRDFMVLGGNQCEPSSVAKGGPCVFLYEAKDRRLEGWEYRGVLFRHADRRLRSVESPCFFRLGDRWVLTISPYGPVEWYTGVFDPDGNSDELFVIENTGHVDGLGYHYASTTVRGAPSRVVLLGWVGGFPEGLGWNGVLALPRQLTLRDGRLFQSLAVDLNTLVSRSWDPLKEEATCGNIFRLRIRASGCHEEIVFPIKAMDGRIVETLTIGPGFVSMDGRRLGFERPAATVCEVVVDRRMTEVFTDTGECVTLVRELLPPSVRIKCERSRGAGFAAELDDLRPVRIDDE